MPARDNAPKGATVTKEELKDEAREKLLASEGKTGSIEGFLQAKKKKEEEISLKEATSADLEAITVSDSKQLKELQASGRLYGYDPKTKTACVLKLAFIEKRDNR